MRLQSQEHSEGGSIFMVVNKKKCYWQQNWALPLVLPLFSSLH